MRDIIKLLEEYEQFRQTGGKALQDFGKWLIDQGNIKEENMYPERLERYKEHIEDTFKNSGSDSLKIMAELSMVWGQMDRYKHYLIKHALFDLPIYNADEFVLLLQAKIYGKRKIKDYIKDSLLEPTTCFEMIKRVKKKGLIKEEQDPNDRRGKLFFLTPFGEEILEKAKSKMNKVNNILFYSLNEAERSEFLNFLKHLSSFHEPVHQKLISFGFEELEKDYQ